MTRFRHIFKIFILALAGLLIIGIAALPFKGTRYLLLRATNSRKHLTEKIIAYKNFAERSKGYLAPHLRLGDFYEQVASLGTDRQANLDRAGKEYEYVLSLDPNNKKALYRLSRIYIKQEKLEKAKPLLEELVSSNPADSKSSLNLAKIYLDAEEEDRALNTINTLIENAPDNPEAHIFKGDLYQKKNDTLNAMISYETAINALNAKEKDFTEAEARYHLGRIYARNNLYFNAIEQFQYITKYWPSASLSYLELANVYFLLEMYDQAIATIMNSPISPATWEASSYGEQQVPDQYKLQIYSLLGHSYFKKKDFVKAHRYFHKCSGLGLEQEKGFLSSLEKLAHSQHLKKTKKNSPSTSSSGNNLGTKYSEGTIISGTVTGITPYGIVVTLPEGSEGVIYTSDLSWGQKHVIPSELFSVGDEVQAMILKTDANNKTTLGIKQITTDPWQQVLEKYKIGERVRGKVSGFSDYAAFIDMPDGTKATLPVSEISWGQNIIYPSDTLSPGENIEAMVIGINETDRELTISIKKLKNDPWSITLEKYKKDTVIEATIDHITDYGIFLSLDGDLKGFLPASEIDKEFSIPLEDLYKPGEAIFVKVKDVDKIHNTVIFTKESL